MTKNYLIWAILNDMYKKMGDHDTKESINKRWKGWLALQNKNQLMQIYLNRRIGK